MPQFILAFPMTKKVGEPLALTETVTLAADATSVIIPGCSVMFKVIHKEHVDGLADIFKEHQEEVSEDELAAIDAHTSLLFLIGEVKNIEEVTQVNTAILKVLDAGALGVYMQQSGAAWTADGFREEVGEECPVSPWLNFVESNDTLYTLGLAVLALPDLCISKSYEEDLLGLKFDLILATEQILNGFLPAKSGAEIQLDVKSYVVLRQEAKSPYSKDDPEYNKQGILRLVKK